MSDVGAEIMQLLGRLEQSVAGLTDRMKTSDEQHREHHHASHLERDLTRKEITDAENFADGKVTALELHMGTRFDQFDKKLNRIAWAVAALGVLQMIDNPKVMDIFTALIRLLGVLA